MFSAAQITLKSLHWAQLGNDSGGGLDSLQSVHKALIWSLALCKEDKKGGRKKMEKRKELEEMINTKDRRQKQD